MNLEHQYIMKTNALSQAIRDSLLTMRPRTTLVAIKASIDYKDRYNGLPNDNMEID